MLYDLYSSTDVVKQAIIAQEKIIRKIADSGSCVLVGRAADYVLKDYDNVISVFIHAPKEYRISKIMEMYGDDKNLAIEHVKRSDHARSSYYRNMSGLKWGDSHNYELCIDASLGEDICVMQICDLYLRKKEK